jgi:hypothetical protein
VVDIMAPLAEAGELHTLGAWACTLCGCAYAALGNACESARWFDELPSKACGNAFDNRMVRKGPALKSRQNPMLKCFELLYHLSQLSRSKGADWMHGGLALIDQHEHDHPGAPPPALGEACVLSLLKGVMHSCAGEPDAARDCLGSIAEDGAGLAADATDSWVLPYAEFELAVADIRERKYDEAKVRLDRVNNWPNTDYQFSDHLAYRCKGATDQLQQMMAPSR